MRTTCAQTDTPSINRIRRTGDSATNCPAPHFLIHVLFVKGLGSRSTVAEKRGRESGPRSSGGLSPHDANGTNRFELEIDQAAVRSNETSPATVNRQARMRD